MQFYNGLAPGDDVSSEVAGTRGLVVDLLRVENTRPQLEVGHLSHK